MRLTVLVTCVSLFVATACSKPEPAGSDKAEPSSASSAPPAAATGGPEAAAKAKEVFATRCTPCHGPTGAGDGPASQGLTPKPRNFHDGAWHASVDDAYIEKIIRYGGSAVGKSPAMPGNPDLSDPAVIAELRSVVRGFKE